MNDREPIEEWPPLNGKTLLIAIVVVAVVGFVSGLVVGCAP